MTYDLETQESDSMRCPQGDDEKLAFLAELYDLCDMMAGPWLLGGDFNMIIRTTVTSINS